MARPKSDDRRAALLAAATEVFAKHGLSAPTALISKTAKVAEGSFFTYFKTKEHMISALYSELRLDLASAIMGDFPRKAGVKQRLQHVFTRYVTWGAENPVARRALKHVTMSTAVDQETRAESRTIFAEVDRIQVDALSQRGLSHLPEEMASQALKAMAEMTMDLVERQPERAEELKQAGFQMLWGALTSKP